MEVKIFCTTMGIFIGKLKKETDEYFEVEDAQMIAADGTKGIAFAPFPPFMDGTVTNIYKEHVICKPYDPVSELKNSYISANSGIDLPNTPPTIQRDSKTIKFN